MLSSPFTLPQLRSGSGNVAFCCLYLSFDHWKVACFIEATGGMRAVGAYFTVFMPVPLSTVSTLLLHLPLLGCFRAVHAVLAPSSVALAVCLWGSACLCIIWLSATTSNCVRNESLISEVWFKLHKWHIKPLGHWLPFISNCGWLLQSPGSSTLSPTPICID